MKNPDRRNKYFFGLGTIGRDMFYAFEANALLYFLSNILSLPIHVFAAVSLVLSVLRIADALNDPITGLVIDNIHTKWGKFKPAILVGRRRVRDLLSDPVRAMSAPARPMSFSSQPRMSSGISAMASMTLPIGRSCPP